VARAINTRKGSDVSLGIFGGGRALRVSTAVTFFLGLLLVSGAVSAHAAFHIEHFDGGFSAAPGGVALPAGSHPDELRTEILFPEGAAGPDGNVRDVDVALPKGVAGNPTATPMCAREQLYTPGGPTCPPSTQIGIAESLIGFGGFQISIPSPLYNVVPVHGTPGQFAFDVLANLILITPHVRTGGDYGITSDVSDINEGVPITGTVLRMWGVPASPEHDAERAGGPSSAVPAPFLTLPTACEGPISTGVEASSWQEPSHFFSSSFQSHAPGDPSTPVAVEGCGDLDFSPSISVQPSVASTDSPTGLSVDLHVPQSENPGGLAEANLKNAVVRLPSGMAVNPSAADGLQGCAPAQIGLQDPSVSSCPDASKIGTLEMTTPLIGHPLPGSVYAASPTDNPFGSVLAMYLVVDDPQSGVVVKLAGKIDADPQTGQLTVTFKENPQLPFEDLKLTIFGGPRSVLVSPPVCGNYDVTTDLTPWTTPEGQDATPLSSFSIGQAVGGGSCPQNAGEEPNASTMQAGSETPLPGSSNPFTLAVSRADGTQRIGAIDTTLPAGLLARLAGVAHCTDAQIAQAASRRNPGEGALEQAQPSCPAASLIGTTTVGAGAGSAPFHISVPVYLAGPYKGAPESLVTIAPVVAGPFDLGVVVVRVAVYIDSHTAQVHAVSDPIPSIVQGIPLDIRSVNFKLDRPGFTFNPTNCVAKSTTAVVTSTQGAAVSSSSPYQVADCADLAFKPSFKVSTSAKTSRTNGASLSVKLTFPHPGPGSSQSAEADTRYVHVQLPKALPSRLKTLQKACTEAVFAANPAACPSASLVGHAVAHTPVLGVPLEGPAYLVSHGGAAFPDLVLVLQGEGIRIDLTGATSINGKTGVTSSTFATIPDAPISSFALTLKQGKYSVLAANGNLCKQKLSMPTTFVAQNGATLSQTTKIAVTGCPAAHAKTKKKKAPKKAKS
jgi:hypothetical protein